MPTKNRCLQQPVASFCKLLVACFLSCLAASANAATYSNVPTTFGWIDPSTHTRATWSNPSLCGGGGDTIGDDSITAAINIGFTFKYGSVNYTQLYIMTNGRLNFGNTFCYPGTQVIGPPRTYTLPYADANLVNTMKVYGADIDVSPAGSGGGPGATTCPAATCSVRYTATPLGTAPNRRFVVTWVNAPDWGSTGSFFNLQVILNENGTFVFQYGASNNPDNGHADVGWQLTTGDFGTIAYANVGALANTAILFFVPTVKWVNNATGSDANAGTQAAPYATIGKGISVMGSGGTVFVQVGNSQSGSPYAANNVVATAQAGSAGLQSLIQGVASGATLPLVRGTDPTADAGFDVQGNYVTIDGFEIQNTLVGIYSEASNTGARISNNFITAPHLGYGIILDNSSTPGTASNGTVFNNRVQAVSGGDSFFGIWDYAGNGNTIDSNKVTGFGSDGIVSHYATGNGGQIVRNIVKNSPLGIHISNAHGAFNIYNNTVDGSAWLGIYAEQSPITVTSRNNIVVNGGHGWGWDGVGTISSNYEDVFNNIGNYNYTVPVTPGANSISAAPNFAQTIDPTAANYYKLNPGSPCINAGTNVGYGVNIGAVP